MYFNVNWKQMLMFSTDCELFILRWSPVILSHWNTAEWCQLRVIQAQALSAKILTVIWDSKTESHSSSSTMAADSVDLGTKEADVQ